MAAYAALVSLVNILEQIKNHPYLSACFPKKQMESLGANIFSLLEFIETYNFHGSSSEAQDLETLIASAAHRAEDVIEFCILNQILSSDYKLDGCVRVEGGGGELESQELYYNEYAFESHIVDQILPGSTEVVPLHQRCLLALQEVILELDCLDNKSLKVKVVRESNDQKPTNSLLGASSIALATGKSSMVGLDAELMKLKDVLTRQEPSRQIISIVGMGGMGKTTLAKNVYEDSIIMHHFDLRAWATISQDYNVIEILEELLSFKEKSTDYAIEVDKLGDQLYKSLFGRRYLIILDDLWSDTIWDSIKFFLPDNRNGSRIVLTTRLSNVASQLHSFCVRIPFLDEHKSWKLFCQKVFGQEECPPELVGIGNVIVEQCRGLALSIVVIGGLLRNSRRTVEYWQNIANNIHSILKSNDKGQCLDVLYLSYTHLPAHLKPCFLYMGTFEENSDIRFSEIIKLWVAEGFIKPNGEEILEEIAEDFLKDLIDRNLVIVCDHRSNGKIRSCRIHDLLRELCSSVAEKEKFFSVVKAHGIPRGLDGARRLINRGQISSFRISEALGSTAVLVRSLIRNADEEPDKFILLRVMKKAFFYPLKYLCMHVNLRYVACQYVVYRLQSSISMLWSLHTISTNGVMNFGPSEFWMMPQLRHVKCSKILLPDPPRKDEEHDSVVLGNLQTLATVANFRWSEDACSRIPNIKKLRIAYDDIWKGYDNSLYKNLHNLGHLHKLESLSIWCSLTTLISIDDLKNAFPSSLTKLSLHGCVHDWEDLTTIIGSLPQLEVLKLKNSFGELSSWNICGDGAFRRLKFLQIRSCALKSWTFDCMSYFPVLKKLILVDLWELNEIPSDIGEIPTLQLIQLEWCNDSAVISAMKIKEEQESFGNYDLQVWVRPMDEIRFRRLRHVVNMQGLSINNIQLLDSSLLLGK